MRRSWPSPSQSWRECRQWKQFLLRKYVAHPPHWKELQGMSSCLRTLASPCINTSHWMNVPRCLVHCSLELWKRLCNQIIWHKNLGHCQNSWERSRNSNWTHPRTNLGWSWRCSPPVLQPKFHDYRTICFLAAISLRAGDEFCSRCWRNIEEQRWSQTFGPDCFRAIVVLKFADMISQGTRPCLDGPRPQEQHGFRAGGFLEEHLLTANLFFERTLAANIAVWILSVYRWLVKNIWWRKLGCFVVSPVRTRSVKSYVIKFSERIFQSQLLFSNERRHATRMCAKSDHVGFSTSLGIQQPISDAKCQTNAIAQSPKIPKYWNRRRCTARNWWPEQRISNPQHVGGSNEGSARRNLRGSGC